MYTQKHVTSPSYAGAYFTFICCFFPDQNPTKYAISQTEPINQLTNQPTNQPTNQLTNWLTN
jgi:hypothetical protein